MEQTQTNSTNTVLLVLVLVAVVGGIIWFVAGTNTPTDQNRDLQVDVTLPADGTGGIGGDGGTNNDTN